MCTVDQHTCTPTSKRLTTFGSSAQRQQREKQTQLRVFNTAFNKGKAAVNFSIHTYIHTYTNIHTYIHTHIHTYTHTYIHTIIHHYTPLYTQFWFISTFCCSQTLHVPTVSAPRLPQLSHHQISHPGRWTGTAGPDPLKLMPFFGHALGSLIRRIVLPVEVQTIFPNIFFSGYGIRFPYPPCFSSLRSQTCQLIVGFGSPGR